MSENIFISCKEIDKKFNMIVVVVTYETLHNTLEKIKKISKESQNRVYCSTLIELLKYTTEEIIKHSEENNQQWEDFCNDVVLYYATRNVLYKDKIPVTLDDLD